MVAAPSIALGELGIDWTLTGRPAREGKGDTTYEELECLGLDNYAGQLVATYRVKRPTGFSGPPCSAGSKEYVAFWADFDDDCTSTYLGTVAVAAHDYITMPAGGLSYAAILPLDVNAYRRLCTEPGLHRVRAVLSWNTPPSTTDPDLGAALGQPHRHPRARAARSPLRRHGAADASSVASIPTRSTRPPA